MGVGSGGTSLPAMRGRPFTLIDPKCTPILEGGTASSSVASTIHHSARCGSRLQEYRQGQGAGGTCNKERGRMQNELRRQAQSCGDGRRWKAAGMPPRGSIPQARSRHPTPFLSQPVIQQSATVPCRSPSQNDASSDIWEIVFACCSALSHPTYPATRQRSPRRRGCLRLPGRQTTAAVSRVQSQQLGPCGAYMLPARRLQMSLRAWRCEEGNAVAHWWRAGRVRSLAACILRFAATNDVIQRAGGLGPLVIATMTAVRLAVLLAASAVETAASCSYVITLDPLAPAEGLRQLQVS